MNDDILFYSKFGMLWCGEGLLESIYIDRLLDVTRSIPHFSGQSKNSFHESSFWVFSKFSVTEITISGQEYNSAAKRKYFSNITIPCVKKYVSDNVQEYNSAAKRKYFSKITIPCVKKYISDNVQNTVE